MRLHASDLTFSQSDGDGFAFRSGAVSLSITALIVLATLPVTTRNLCNFSNGCGCTAIRFSRICMWTHFSFNANTSLKQLTVSSGLQPLNWPGGVSLHVDTAVRETCAGLRPIYFTFELYTGCEVQSMCTSTKRGFQTTGGPPEQFVL